MLKQTFRNKSAFQYFEKASNQIYSGNGEKVIRTHTGWQEAQDVTWPVRCTWAASFLSFRYHWLLLFLVVPSLALPDNRSTQRPNALPSGLMLASPRALPQQAWKLQESVLCPSLIAISEENLSLFWQFVLFLRKKWVDSGAIFGTWNNYVFYCISILSLYG